MATYYWVGGNGTWNGSTTTNWAASSGGAGSAGFPTSADSVIFDANSGASPVVTVTAAVCSACTIGAPTSGTLTLAFGASTLTMAGNMSITTSISVTGTGTINLSAASPTFAGNGNTFYNVTFTSTASGTATITGANTFNNLTFTSLAATGYRGISFAANQTINGTLTLGTANTSIRRMIVYSSVLGTQRTLTVATIAALNDIDFQDIVAAGASGTWSGTRLGNATNNSNITFDAGKNVYWNLAAGGNWSSTAWALSSGAGVNANNFPLPQDTAIIENTGLNTSASIALDLGWYIGSINASTRSNAMTFATAGRNPTFFGNITYSSSVTTSGTGALTFSGYGITQTITTAAVAFTQGITVNSIGGTVTLADNLTTSRTVTLTSGTLNLNDKTLTCNIFSGTGTNTRAIAFGTGNITTTGSGTVWNTASTTGFSYTGTPTVNISNNSATATTVSTGAMIEAQALNFNYTTGTYTLTDTNAVYKSVNFTGFSGTIPNSTRTIYGGLTFSAGMTLTAGANVTTFAATSGTNNITTAAKTLDFPITFFGLGGTFAFQDALTQGSTRAFTITAGTVQLKASATSTTGVFATSGSSQKFLQSTTPGTQATLTQASGTVNASYLTIRDINAIGGATWFAPISQFNVDAGNNDGWDFFVQLGQYMYTRRKNKRLLINY
jgi:hypothetical protein